MDLTAVVPIWSVTCGQDWTLVAAASQRQAQLLVIGVHAKRGIIPAAELEWRVKARRATDADVGRMRSFAEQGVEAAGEVLETLGIAFTFAPPDEDEPAQLALL